MRTVGYQNITLMASIWEFREKGQGLSYINWKHKKQSIERCHFVCVDTTMCAEILNVRSYLKNMFILYIFKNVIYLLGEEDWSQFCVGPGVAPSNWHESGRTWKCRQNFNEYWSEKLAPLAWSRASLEARWKVNKLHRLALSATTCKMTLHLPLMNNEYFLLQSVMW